MHAEAGIKVTFSALVHSTNSPRPFRVSNRFGFADCPLLRCHLQRYSRSESIEPLLLRMGRLLACGNVVHQLACSDLPVRSFPPISSFQAGVRFHFLQDFKSLIMLASPLA